MSFHTIDNNIHTTTNATSNGILEPVGRPANDSFNGDESSRGKTTSTSTTSHSHLDDGFSTRAIHIGSEPSLDSNSVIPPISLSTTYKQNGVGIHKGYEYSRSSNPNRHAFERMMASLEDGPRIDTDSEDATSSDIMTRTRGFAFASGSAATATILQALGPDSHVLCINDVYGGTYRYLERVAKGLTNLSTTFIDFENATDDNILNAIRPNTKLIWIESPTNPTLRLADIPRISSLIHSHPNTNTTIPRFSASTRPLILIDGTFLSPFYISPLKSPINADIALHSVTKYINGHSDVVMGALVVRAREPAPPNSAAPPQHHPLLEALPETLTFLQNAHGAIPSAFDSWLAQRGAKTLALRMKQHGLNALTLARSLKRNPYIKDVVYPGLKEHPANPIAWSILSGSWASKWIKSQGFKRDEQGRGDVPFGGMISIRLDLSRITTTTTTSSSSVPETFLTSLRLFTLAESLGGVESLAELPALMTHAGIPAAERAALGIDDGLVRLSVGVEDVSDLMADLEQALESAFGATNGSGGAITPGGDSNSTVEEDTGLSDGEAE